MKRFFMVMSLALASCTSNEVESGLLVTLELDPGLVSKCVQLVARVGATERRSGAIELTGMTKTSVAVARGDFNDVVTLQALGFSDAECRTLTAPAESSLATEARFIKNVAATPVLLRVRREASLGEQCANGLDDDDDALVDCDDSDCNGKACSLGNACVVEQFCSDKVCTGGTVKKCLTPPTACFAASGNCEAPGGECLYAPRVAASCDDVDPCTTTDQCDSTGTCKGTPKVCNAPPSQCFSSSGTCSGNGTCSYALNEGGVCNDGQSCTINDRCAADAGCSGVQVTCPTRECQTFANACDGDGGCKYTPTAAGTACKPGAICNGGGSCIDDFPYELSNLTEAQIPNPPSGESTVNCGETIIDTSTTPPTVTNWCVAGTPDFGVAVVAQPDEQPLMVIAFKSLTVASGSSLVFRGHRNPVIVVTGDAQILGTITSESGARACAVGAGKAGSSSISNGGGGGGGFGSTGATGGQGIGGTTGGAGGGTDGTQTLIPLRGGCPGGRGGDNNASNAPGGGSLQISVAGVLTISGTVNAPGRGGAAGTGVTGLTPAVAGNGGGSGGAILLEADSMVLTDSSKLAANGGGGGQAGDVANGNGQAGQDGTTSLTPAAGGTSGLGGPGGNGATQNSASADGSDSGGAGGGVGRIRLNTVAGCTVNPAALMTPNPTSRQAGSGCL